MGAERAREVGCLLRGHRWKFEGQSVDGAIVHRCKRCGRVKINGRLR